MKMPDLGSTIVAALLGAGALLLASAVMELNSDTWKVGAAGAVVGASVQIGVRLMGVS